MQFSKKIILGILSLSVIAAVAPAQTISIVSGDGQVTPQNFQAQLSMIVVVKNAQGAPQSGVTVTWTVPSGQGALSGNGTDLNAQSCSGSVTNSNGQAAIIFLGQQPIRR